MARKAKKSAYEVAVALVNNQKFVEAADCLLRSSHYPEKQLALLQHIGEELLAKLDIRQAQYCFWKVAQIQPRYYWENNTAFREFSNPSEKLKLRLGPAKNGSFTACVQVNQEVVVLSDGVNPEKAGEQWLKQQLTSAAVYQLPLLAGESETINRLENTELTEHTLYVVAGVGLGYHLLPLIEQLPENSHILAILNTPQDDFLWLAGKIPEVGDKLFNKDKLTVLSGLTEEAIFPQLYDKLKRRAIRNIRFLQYQPALFGFSGFEELKAKLLQAVTDSLKQEAEIYSQLEPLENAWRNLPSILTNGGIAAVKDALQGCPVVLVAAGPSLNKNIAVLKEYADKLVIIASGSAIGALHKHGIIPQFLVVADPYNRNFSELETYLHPETILVTSYYAMADAAVKFPGRKLFFEFEAFPLPCPFYGLEAYLPEFGCLRAKASVAGSAFSFALSTGADPVIIIGQDCSFPNDNNHADGVSAHGYNDREFEYIDGYYGDKVKTIPEFRQLVQFFSEQCKQYGQSRRIVNATEGGAYIPGMEHLPLHTVLQAMKLQQRPELLPVMNSLVGRQEQAAICAVIEQYRGEIQLLHSKICTWLGQTSKPYNWESCGCIEQDILQNPLLIRLQWFWNSYHCKALMSKNAVSAGTGECSQEFTLLYTQLCEYLLCLLQTLDDKTTEALQQIKELG